MKPGIDYSITASIDAKGNLSLMAQAPGSTATEDITPLVRDYVNKAHPETNSPKTAGKGKKGQ